jgi:hypothetical protein
MNKIFSIALSTALVLALATPALAAKPASLAPGGRTLAGPGSRSLAADSTETVYTDSSGNADACATVVNTGKVALDLTLVGGGTSTISVPVSSSSSLCIDSITRVDLTCPAGTVACSAQWRVDNN